MRVDREARARELFAYEAPWRAKAICAGMDEVGRGPLAGCVMAACVIMPVEPLISWVDDSKRLSEMRRERVYEEIMRTAVYVGIGQAEPDEIDAVNILWATRLAMKRAAENAPADIFLIDAVGGTGLSGVEVPVVHGDTLSYSIAAASIVAKVTRDRLMRELDERYPMYGFARNKGYGTAQHIAAIREQGPCPIHRRSFLVNIQGCQG